MGHAISVQHGVYGRASLLRLDRPFVTHAHREAHLIFRVGGSGSLVTVDGVPVVADEIMAVAVNPWEPHGFEVLPGGAPSTCLVLYIRPEWFAEEFCRGKPMLQYGQPQFQVTPDLAHWVYRLSDMLGSQQRNASAAECLSEIAARSHALTWKQAAASPTDRYSQTSLDRRVSRAVGLMDERFAEDIEMNWLARESGLSRPHFFKLFKCNMGVTPNIYLNTLRSERAIDDLLDPTKSVTEIGYDLGFSSQASFTRFFSANLGMPPSDYRRAALVS